MRMRPMHPARRNLDVYFLCLIVEEEKIIKGIFSDCNNIFLWYESEDINKKSLFPKFQLIPILRFQVNSGA